MNHNPVLAVLKERFGAFVSGEELGRHAGVSRTAIWKRINHIRSLGYGIESSTRRGYRLVKVTGKLIPEEVGWGLNTATVGRSILHYDEVASTNEEAKRLAIEGAEDGAVLIAEEQTGGRGRLGRGWISPRGGIWLSVILRPRIAPSDGPKVMMLAASSVFATLRSAGLAASIKWPNDIIVGGKKVCGILTEMASQPEIVDHIIVGIGLNANISLELFSTDIRACATSLEAELGHPVERLKLVQGLLQGLDVRYAGLKKGNFDSIVGEWRGACGTIGQEIELSTASGTVGGLAVGVDGCGAIVLRLSDGSERAFSAGEVTVVKR
ncbi:MAG: biotin--[acetyl-CoA-carboxylase] ligase [Chloroflexi bacterium]|nr:biotin--[acetyl-CoA-carboxylase] ligase [Chloroflexota bacterium]